jgi:hypothetical protein
MYHGIIIDKSLTDSSFLKKIKTFAFKQSGDWKICGVEIEDSEIGKTINEIKKGHNERNGMFF